ncbi:very short patch repair endonuclease [Endozoicomonas sp. Mp262]|uniref:very short patch repair endonuclease n=1 Tax=Endozoicomonas sp. Mp262 TaxID=2919499 RepID=UPI0021D7E284
MKTTLDETRSYIMASIHSKNTKPELIVRKKLHALGFRFRIHARELPGSPDLVLPKYKAVIQVNGCFWHGHDCPLFKMPKTRTEFWYKKISGNQERDKTNTGKLLMLGWRIMVIWECAIRGKQRIDENIWASLIENWLLVGNDFIELRGNTP